MPTDVYLPIAIAAKRTGRSQQAILRAARDGRLESRTTKDGRREVLLSGVEKAVKAPPRNDELDAACGRAMTRIINDTGLSRAAFGRKCELHTNTVRGLESGVGAPAVRSLWKIAEFLGVPLATVAAYIDEEMANA